MENNNDIVKSYLVDRRKKWTKYLMGIMVVLMTLFTTYLVHTSSSLNLADLTGVGVPVGASEIYMPNYEGGIGEVGSLEIKTAAGLPSFDSITFSLNYSPIDSLIFDSNPIVFNAGTRFQNAAFQMTASPEDGKLIVTVILEDPIADILADETLFELNTKLNPNLPEGQVIDVTFDDFALLDGINPLIVSAIPTSTITVAGQNELKVLNAEALDATHVAIQFSDILSDIGDATHYDVLPGSIDTAVQPGSSYGLGQDYVVIVTTAQTPGTEYTVKVTSDGGDPDIIGNQQKQVDAQFSNVVFYGFGDTAGVLSDFEMVSATVSGYNTINVVFSDDLETASVTKSDFILSIQGGAAVTVDGINSVIGNQVSLSVSTPLLKDNTYLLSAVSTDSILRNSDSAELGVDRVAFAGVKNGPRLIGASVSESGGVYTASLTFDEDVMVVSGGSYAHGQVFNTDGTHIIENGADDIDNTNIGIWNQSISGKTLTIDNPRFGSADENFIFSVSTPAWLTNSQGVPVDDTYKSISFWGYNHNNISNSIGTIDVTGKNTFLIPGGNLDFDAVVKADVTVNYIDTPDSVAIETISSVIKNGNDLQVVMNGSFDPDRHYTVRIVDDTTSDNTLAAKDFVISRELSISSAEAISSSEVRVFFSESIDSDDVDSSDFQINNGLIVVNSLTVDSGYQSVTLETAGPFTASTIFKATVSNPDDVYSYEGDYILKNSAYFTGFGTLAAISPTHLDTVDTINSQTLRMNFSGDVDEANFTPVNLDIFYFDNPADPSSRTELVVTDITRVNATTYELSTSVQASGENYFVIFNGVEDAGGLILGNVKPKNFFGFELPEVTVNLVTPSVLSNDLETNVVLSGQNMDIVEEVRVGSEVMTIVSKTATSIVFTVPAQFTNNLYNITLIDSANSSLTFQNALLVTLPVAELTVHSAQSQSIPQNVPNDGTTPATLWLLVEDPVGLASISSVVTDLSQIGGDSVVEMTKDTGTQPLYSQWYTYEITVPATVATQDAPYLLPVEIRKGSEVYSGTISIRVTNDVVQSVPPVVDNVYVSPISVAPDGVTNVRISAQVSDMDGAHTINSVVADLGALGIGYVTLSPISEITEGTELETQFYQSEEFTIPKSTDDGDYIINVVASDVTGESVTVTVPFQVSASANGPTIDSELSYVSPRKSIPNDGKTTFDLNVFVTDVDGIDTVNDVTANFNSIGLPPMRLTKDADTSAGGNSAWFKAVGLTIPKTAPFGIHDIQVIATDTAGGIGSILLRVEATHKDTLGDPPRVIEDRAYTTPSVAINDGESPVTLYAFIRDDDDDIESVIVNLSTIGQVGTETSGVMGSDTTSLSDGSCPTGSNVLVCMNPSVKEGDNGQWFILPGVVINKNISPSPNPYQVEIIVTDSGRKTTSGIIPVYVGTGDDITDQQEPPRVLAAIPTSETTIEILFSKELSANSVLSSGKGFNITGITSTTDVLSIYGTTINPAGNVVTLSTANQVPGKGYVLSVSNIIKDLVGRSVQEGSANRISFNGFKAIGRAPIAEYISATSFDTVEVEFRKNLKPSAIRMGLTDLAGSSQFGVKIYESENTSNKLDILGVTLLSPGNILQIKTENQLPDMKYRINFEGLETYDGSKVLSPINKGFKGYNLSVAQHFAAANVADLNGDGKVDFTDFTIFSSVYGTIYFGQGENVAEASANATNQASNAGQPLEENPDAIVPITSQPDGGNVQ